MFTGYFFSDLVTWKVHTLESRARWICVTAAHHLLSLVRTAAGIWITRITRIESPFVGLGKESAPRVGTARKAMDAPGVIRALR